MGGRGHTSPCGWSVTGVGSTLVHYSSVSTLLVGVIVGWYMIIIVGMQINDNRSDELLQAAWPEASQVHAMLSPRAQDRTGRCVISPSRTMLSPPHYGLRRHTIHSLLGPQTRHSLQQPFNLIHCHPQRRGERGERRERVREPFLNFYTNASLPKPKTIFIHG